MRASETAAGAGTLLREWRQQRRRSQLDLALDAGVSTRHLSFVETGRARPSREMLLRLCEELEVPLRERNRLLLAAGYAPLYRETPLDSGELAPVRQALRRILRVHEPFPALVVNVRWELVLANGPALQFLGDDVAPWLREAPVNVVRVSLHPEGLAPRIANFAEYSAHMLHRLRRQLEVTRDPGLAALYDEVRGYPGVVETPVAPNPAEMLFVPLVLRMAGGAEQTFFSTVATFGTALDVTVAELAIESFYPADAEVLAQAAGPATGPA